MSNIIIKRGSPIINEYALTEEVNAGHVVRLQANGKVSKAGGNAGDKIPLTVVKETDSGVDVAIAEESTVSVFSASTGTIFMARAKKSADPILKGDLLQSSGDGTLEKLVDGEEPLAIAREDKDNSGDALKEPLFLVEAI